MEQYEHPLKSLQRRLDDLWLKSLSPQPLLNNNRTLAAQELGVLCNEAMAALAEGADLFDINTRVFVFMMMATLQQHFGIEGSKIAFLQSTEQVPRTIDGLVQAWDLGVNSQGYNAARVQMSLRLTFAAEAFSNAQFPMETRLQEFMGRPVNGNSREIVDLQIKNMVREGLSIARLEATQGQSFEARINRFIDATFVQYSPATI